jgi:hypothetical protein
MKQTVKRDEGEGGREFCDKFQKLIIRNINN